MQPAVYVASLTKKYFADSLKPVRKKTVAERAAYQKSLYLETLRFRRALRNKCNKNPTNQVVEDVFPLCFTFRYCLPFNFADCY